MRRQSKLVVALVAALMVLGCTTAVATATSTPVECDIADNTLTCPLPPPPAPVTETATVTTTVTAPAGAENLFGDATPANPADADNKAVELGVKFKPAVNGVITGVRFYKGAGNTGTHTGSLWSGTTRVATATFSGETETGWQSVLFATPVFVKAGTEHIASYLAPAGHYAGDGGFAWPKVSGNLTASGGFYKYDGGLPTQTYQNTNYYVDVMFLATGNPPPATTTAPTTSGPATTTAPATTSAQTTPATTSTAATTAPPPAGKPGPTNTGVPAGTALTPYTGPSTITVDGTVIDGKDVAGSLIIRAKNVTIKNSKIHDDMGAVAGINVQDGGSATITDSEIYNFQVGIVYANWTGVRLNMHDISFDGIKMSSNAELRDSWIHSPKPTADAHWDGIQVQNGVVNTKITGNFIDAGDQSAVDTNSALFLVPDLGASTDGPLTVQNNWLNGGNYTVYILNGRDGQTIRDITFTGNRFGRSSKYGPKYVNVPVTWSGNVWDDDGSPVNL